MKEEYEGFDIGTGAGIASDERPDIITKEWT